MVSSRRTSSTRSSPLSGPVDEFAEREGAVEPPLSRSELALRDDVHAQLETLIGVESGSRLPADPNHHDPVFTDDLLIRVARDYRASKPKPARGGAMMLVTAGPPGAGKSHWVDRAIGQRDYLAIDPDEVKDLLLVEAQKLRLLDDARGIVLADGRPIGPRELSARVHQPANVVADRVRLAAMRRRENIIMEGTLSWPDLAERYAGELLENEYERLDIVSVEVTAAMAVEGAISRWWRGRKEEALGGRFMSRAAVQRYYADPVDEQVHSRCVETADSLWRATHDVVDVLYRRIERTAEGERVTPVAPDSDV